MVTFIVAFFSGVVFLQSCSRLPGAGVVIFLVAAAITCWWLFRKRLPAAHIVVAFTTGYAWAVWYAHDAMSWTLAREWEGKVLSASGYIRSLPVPTPFGVRFEFYLEDLSDGVRSEHPHKLIRLNWPGGSRYESVIIQPGDKWCLSVRLKRIHGMMNPGTFDFEAWALQKGLRAVGTVMRSASNQMIVGQWYDYPIQRIRYHLQNKLFHYQPSPPMSKWLSAFVTGERQNISESEWKVLRQTGTNHLMAIGGLHIGIMSGFVYSIMVWIWKRCPRLMLIMPAQHAGLAVSFLTAIFYGALSGFLIPAQRACLMFTAGMVAIMSNRTVSAWRAWALALFAILIVNPLCVLSESFWLSFGTIALIIYGMRQRISPAGWWWKWGRVQWVIAVGLIPISLIFFQQCSLIAFAANLIAIPWLAVGILPWCYLGVILLYVFPPFGVVLLTLAAKSLTLLWLLLDWMSRLTMAVLHIYLPDYVTCAMTLIGFLVLLLPGGWPGRWLGLFWLLPMLTWHASKPSNGDFWMTLLDVGQGLSIVIQTQHHVLVYDAGPNALYQSDAGENIVVPYLRTLAVRQVDKLVISHGDNDHIGGAQAIIHAMNVKRIETSVPDKIKETSTHLCQRGHDWQWDGVRFQYLYPGSRDLGLGNDSSCVLSIDNGVHRILLPGDIEKVAEKQLTTYWQKELLSDVLIAPHHGSKTSGLAAFIMSVHPRYVLYAAGYHNRYHLPSAKIVAQYEKVKAKAYNTVDTGMIQFKITRDHDIQRPECYRESHAKYWYSD